MDLCIRHGTGTFENVFKIKVQIKVKVAANARVRLSLQEVKKPKDVMEKLVFVCLCVWAALRRSSCSAGAFGYITDKSAGYTGI